MAEETMNVAVQDTAQEEGAPAGQQVPAEVDTPEQPLDQPSNTNDGDEVTVTEEETGNDVGSSLAASVESEPITYMPVYNGKVVPITGDKKAEIETLIQKGMKYDSMSETLEKLNSIAAHLKHNTIREWADATYADMEKTLREDAIREYGPEDGEELYRLRKEERERRFRTYAEKEAEEDSKTRAALEEAIAAQFMELQEVYPEYHSVKEIPQKVVNLALEKGISLLDAKNRIALQQQRQAAAAAQKQESNANASTGSLAGRAEVSNPKLEAFLAGLNQRI